MPPPQPQLPQPTMLASAPYSSPQRLPSRSSALCSSASKSEGVSVVASPLEARAQRTGLTTLRTCILGFVATHYILLTLDASLVFCSDDHIRLALLCQGLVGSAVLLGWMERVRGQAASSALHVGAVHQLITSAMLSSCHTNCRFPVFLPFLLLLALLLGPRQHPSCRTLALGLPVLCAFLGVSASVVGLFASWAPSPWAFRPWVEVGSVASMVVWMFIARQLEESRSQGVVVPGRGAEASGARGSVTESEAGVLCSSHEGTAPPSETFADTLVGAPSQSDPSYALTETLGRSLDWSFREVGPPVPTGGAPRNPLAFSETPGQR
eukprot:TRINITY_DN10014_c1_g2_i2.p1 TRINITY_DN10014_c1_g2~~TRINITY_DN10014_c1_g2_i2.p1  ORF type:complete len:324 (+),score=26.43 TRINITY_DN10014_c1_g2_i2:83-1054(+)